MVLSEFYLPVSWKSAYIYWERGNSLGNLWHYFVALPLYSHPLQHSSSCILKSSHHCSLMISLEALHIFVSMSWKQYWQYILCVQALSEQCSIAHRDPRVFIKPYSLIVGCSAACCMLFQDLLPWSSDSITGFALIICKYDSAAEQISVLVSWTYESVN